MNLYFVALCLILCLNVIDADPKRSFGLIRSRPKPNNLSIRRQQKPAQYTPQAAAAPAVAKSVKPVASAPAAPAPAGPPPPYSPHPVKNIGASNAAPPPYTPYHQAPPSYQSAMGHGSPYPNANYPRQGYSGVNQGGAYNQGVQPNYAHNAMAGHPPYSGGMYNGYNNGGMGMGGMNPGMAAGGMGMMGGMGGMGMGGGMGGMGGGMGYGYQQKPQSMFTMRNVLTGLALYSGARMIGGALSGGGGYGGGYGYGGGSSTQHVYIHHENQPQVIVQGVPIAVQPQPGDTPAAGVNSGVQPLNPAGAYLPISYANATAPIEVPATPTGTISPIITQTAENRAPENIQDPNIPTEIPLGLDSFPTIHPSLYTYAYGTEDILYWASSHNKNLSLSTDTTQSPTTQKSVTVSDMTV